MEKEENTGIQHFLLYLQCFPKALFFLGGIVKKGLFGKRFSTQIYASDLTLLMITAGKEADKKLLFISLFKNDLARQ